MEQFKAKSIFLGGSLDHIAVIQQHSSNPVTTLQRENKQSIREDAGKLRGLNYFRLGRLVEEQQTWFEHTPQLGPTLEGASDLEPIGQDDDCWIFQGAQQLVGHPLFLLPVGFPLSLVRLFAVQFTTVPLKSPLF